MNTEDFDETVAAAMARMPGWFSEVETPATDQDALAVERLLGVALPDEYKHFARKFGAGYFGQANVTSLRADSEWYRANSLVQLTENRTLYVLSDDQTGGFYGFILKANHCGNDVVYVQPDDGGDIEPVAQSFFDYIVENALPTP